jgi:HAD superfamily hydrolase (TIGR01509 family)
MPFGAIFDWDGVIIDSSVYHKQSWELMAAEEGRPLPPDHFKKGFGMKNVTIIRDLLGWTNDPAELERLGSRKEVLYRKLIARSGIDLLPGVRSFLETLQTNHVPCVIGSSTPRQNLTVVLQMKELGHFFQDIVASEDVSLGKPDPEVFIKAAQKTGFPPASCVVFEDSLMGIEAGLRGGMKVVAVASTNPPSLLTHAHRVVQRLDELTIRELEAFFTQG